MTALLQVRNVTVRFGANTAVDDVSLEIEPGTIVGLIGPNGAGKTTLFNVIAGIQHSVAGSVRFEGRDITHAPPHVRAHRGIARTFQRLETFGTLTVQENVLVGAEARGGRGAAGRHAQELAKELCRKFNLDGIADERADSLATGTQRLVEMARALATGPRLLLLDEASSGLTSFETKEVATTLRALADDGLTIVLVEHDMSFVMGLCDRIAMLERGSLVADGTPEEVSHMPAVIEAYLGSEHKAGAAS
ncbi:ABC transporter ATP-binding protein [Nocardioides houyundeii]|uniref:ABC transporter ATP-binding protein n=1 Tax=Nocardioides houyundeii TaxID=2045452 RepID=UPI000DF152E1|nr:ABC transporter ATP-binding protein [Nocardioides houyundeii]